VIDLGLQPLANNLLRPEDIGKPEPKFPLEMAVCGTCWLMQITHIVPPVTLFSEYVYFSSFSDEMLRHARQASLRYILEKKLGASSFVLEIASNDGYLLKNFVQTGVPCLGVECAANIAEVARAAGVNTVREFFGSATAAQLKEQYGAADLILGNNVFAHVPTPNDFVAGLRTALKPDGWIVLEFPYGVDMLEKSEFDCIYHEHVFCFALTPLLPLFARHGLEIFHLERVSIHGGTLRIFAAHQGAEPVRPSVSQCQAEEEAYGVSKTACYEGFQKRAAKIAEDLATFLDQQGGAGKRVAAYGAAAKGSTLLNCIGDVAGALEFIADRSPHKQGKLSPGIHVPIVAAEELAQRQPDYAVILAWNFGQEIMEQQDRFVKQGGRFVIPLPKLQII